MGAAPRLRIRDAFSAASVVAWLVVASHALQGIAQAASSEPLLTTPTAYVAGWFGRAGAPAAFLGAAAAMVVGLAARGRWGLVLAIPQQLLLVAASVAVVSAAWAGHYADLEPRPQLFILSDQVLVLAVTIGHAVGVALHDARR